MKYLKKSTLALALLMGFAGAAHADSQQTARQAFKQGRDAFKAGRFEEAIKQLKMAHSIKPHPALLRYIGQTYAKMGEAKLAVENFKRYVREAPQAPDKDKIQDQIGKLQRAIAAAEADADAKAKAKADAKTNAAAASQAAKPEQEATSSSIDLRPTGEDAEMPDVIVAPKKTKGKKAGRVNVMRIAKWSATAAGIGALAAGLVFNILSSGAVADLEAGAKANNPNLDTPAQSYKKEHFELQQDYQRYNTMAIVSYITGGVLTAAGVALFIVDGRRSAKERRAARHSNVALTPAVGDGFYGFSSTIRF